MPVDVAEVVLVDNLGVLFLQGFHDVLLDFPAFGAVDTVDRKTLAFDGILVAVGEVRVAGCDHLAIPFADHLHDFRDDCLCGRIFQNAVNEVVLHIDYYEYLFCSFHDCFLLMKIILH